MWEKYELCLLEKKLKLAFLTNSGHHSIGRGEMGVYRWGTAKAEPRETLNTGGRCHSSLGPWAVLTLCGQSCTEAHTGGEPRAALPEGAVRAWEVDRGAVDFILTLLGGS